MGNAFRQGEHICALYQTEEEQIAVAAEYLADGLRAGERVFYVAEVRCRSQSFSGRPQPPGDQCSRHGQAGCAG